jgi:hypothetical protein
LAGRHFARGVGRGGWGVRQKRPWLSGKYWYSKNKLFAEMIRQTRKQYLQTITEQLRIKN